MCWCVNFCSPGEKAVLACGRSVSIARVALLAAERRPALDVSFVRGGNINVTLTQPLARTQTGAGLSKHARVILRTRRRVCKTLQMSGTFGSGHLRKLQIIKWELTSFPNRMCVTIVMWIWMWVSLNCKQEEIVKGKGGGKIQMGGIIHYLGGPSVQMF